MTVSQDWQGACRVTGTATDREREKEKDREVGWVEEEEGGGDPELSCKKK